MEMARRCLTLCVVGLLQRIYLLQMTLAIGYLCFGFVDCVCLCLGWAVLRFNLLAKTIAMSDKFDVVKRERRERVCLRFAMQLLISEPICPRAHTRANLTRCTRW